MKKSYSFESIMQELQQGKYHPVYFLTGEEAYYIDTISDFIADNVLDEGEKSFNQTVMYGRDATPQLIIESAKRFPMMSSHQVVIVKEAQDIKNLEPLESYIKNPLDSTILVICYKYKKPDGRTAFGKILKQKAVYFESKKVYDNKMPGWITDYLKKKNYRISPKACYLLTEHLGTNLGKVANELEKLIINLPPKSEVTALLIEQNIGISKDYNNFELQNALGQRNVTKANSIVHYFGQNPKDHSIFATISSLYSFFTKILQFHYVQNKNPQNLASALSINPFFVKDYTLAAKNFSISQAVKAIHYLREYDMKAKGVDNVSANEGELQKELIYRVLH